MAVAQRNIQNHYETLGVTSLASLEEIRRAYRILARRYHPDVNPGRNSEERFKAIAEAYKVLSDEAKRREFDRSFEDEAKQAFDRGHAAYQQAIRRAAARDRARRRYEAARESATTHAGATDANNSKSSRGQETKASSQPHPGADSSVLRSLGRLGSLGARRLRGLIFDHGNTRDSQNSARARPAQSSAPRRVSVIEVSVSLLDAVQGGRRSVEITEPEGIRKVSIKVPPGVRNGSVLRTRAKNSDEELVVIMRVAPHPFLDLQRKGLVCLIPITVQEAIGGAQITVPTLDDQVVLKVPAGSQSGTELRLKGRGVTHADGSRGDLIYRLMIQIPPSSEAVGLKDCAAALEKYYGTAVRSELPKQLLG